MMGPPRAVFALLATLLLVPVASPDPWLASASGGRFTDPEGGPRATDPAGDSSGGAGSDMLATWFAIEEGELAVHWQVVGAAIAPDACWNLDFRVNDAAYWVLYAYAIEGRVEAAVRSEQFLFDGSGSALVTTDGHPVLNGLVQVEVAPGAVSTFTVRYDAGVFPLRAGDVLRLTEHAYSCRGHAGSPTDRIARASYVVPADTWRPEPTGRVYAAPGPGAYGWATLLDPCDGIEAPEAGWTCFRVPEEDRGAAYVLETVPPMPLSSAFGASGFAFLFRDDAGAFQIYGEPGGIPLRATRFEAQTTAPIVSWSFQTR